jgi:hypothetical protein
MPGKRKLISQRKLRAILFLAAAGGLSMAFPHHVSATTDSWIGTSGGNWTDGTQWRAGVPPTAGQDVWITNAFSGSQTITFDQGNSSLTYNSLTLDATGGGTNQLYIASNTLTASGAEYIGNSGAIGGGSGAVVQIGGTHSLSGSASIYLGYNPSDLGTYALSSGTLGAGAEYVGFNGTGNFIQTDGTNAFNGGSGSLYVGANIGSTGTYTLSGGSLSNIQDVFYSGGNEYIGNQGIGDFNQSGGSNTTFFLSIGSNGGTGTYQLGAGATLNARIGIGESGKGAFVQTGGALVGNIIDLTVGSYSVSGGVIITSTEFVHGGVFNQSGGANTTAGLGVGDAAGSTGTYTFSSGSLNVTQDNEGIGGSFGNVLKGGAGNFIQTGGTHSTLQLSLGVAQQSSGTYTLSAGGLNTEY